MKKFRLNYTVTREFTIPDTATDEEYSEEEYLEERNSQRGDEINKILSFLGY